jgi:hypothetical protein
VEFFAPPSRWRAADAPEVEQVADPPVTVERVGSPGRGYSVFLTADGIYRIFIHTPRVGAPAYIKLPFRPDVLRLCDSGESFDRQSRRCSPIKGMMIPKFE